MPGAFGRLHSFRRGCLGNNGRVLFLLVNDTLTLEAAPHTAVVLWVNGRFTPIVTVAWTACAAVYLDWPAVEFAVVGERGELLLINSESQHTEASLIDSEPRSPGMFKAAACIDSRLVAVGAGYWARVATKDGGLIDVSPQAVSPGLDTPGVGFEGVDGFSANDFYAVGWDGEIWHFDGIRWSPKASPTNMILTQPVCAPTGDVWIAGQHGTIIRGRGDVWRALKSGIAANLWSAAWFGDAVFMAASQELFRIGDDELPQSVGLESDPKSFYWLDAKRGVVMLSTGPKDVVLVLPDREIKIE